MLTRIPRRVGRKLVRRYGKKTYKPKLSKPLRAAMTRVAKKVISRRAEDKAIGIMVEDSILHNSGISSADCEPVIPEVSQGTTSRDRTGDRLTPKSLRLNGIVSLNTAVSPPNGRSDIYARVMVLAQKDVKTGGQVLGGSVNAGSLLKPGFGGTAIEQPFAGDTQDILKPINTDLFRVYMDKTFKLSQVSEGAIEQNGSYSALWSYTFTKKNLPASLTYDEGNVDWANNFAPFLCVGYAYSDGTSPDTVATKVMSTCYAELKFEDL